jgi:hypothetical protein
MYTKQESELIQQYLQRYGQTPGASKEVAVSHELEAQGWTCQFTVEAERADEYVELYESLGNEVLVKPVTPGLQVAEECTTCLLAACDRYVVIYTRPTDI